MYEKLVERLRARTVPGVTERPTGPQTTLVLDSDCQEAAQAIERLSAALADKEAVRLQWRETALKTEFELAEARAREGRYQTALTSIAKNTCCDRCQEAALVAQEALAAPAPGKDSEGKE